MTGIYFVLALIFVLAVIVFVIYREDIKTTRKIRQTRVLMRDCSVCAHRGTMDCPNSSLCWSTSDKPYFEPEEEDEQK